VIRGLVYIAQFPVPLLHPLKPPVFIDGGYGILDSKTPRTYLTLPWDIRGSEVSVMLVRISEAIVSVGCSNRRHLGIWIRRPVCGSDGSGNADSE
jgi:hypothetical protein